MQTHKRLKRTLALLIILHDTTQTQSNSRDTTQYRKSLVVIIVVSLDWIFSDALHKIFDVNTCSQFWVPMLVFTVSLH